MLEQIASLVKQYGEEAVVNNPDIPASANNEVLAEATHTITGGMQNMLAGGGLQDILSLFTNGNKSQEGDDQSSGIGGLIKSPVVSMMIGHFINKLVSKFKLSPEKASSVSNSIIPNVITDLVHRTKDNSPANDSFDLNDLIGSLTGGNKENTEEATPGNGFDFQGLLNQFTKGGGSGNKSGFDLQDIIGKITNSAQQSQAQQSGGGGLMDLIKGFL